MLVLIVAAKCMTSCANDGSCISPDVCQCRPGFTDFDCRVGTLKYIVSQVVLDVHVFVL